MEHNFVILQCLIQSKNYNLNIIFYFQVKYFRIMVNNKKYKELNFWTCKEDRPLIA